MFTHTATYNNTTFLERKTLKNNTRSTKVELVYSAFGAPLSGRTFSSPNYKYGFNGKEKDAEMHGNDGDSYDFGARMYDVRVGRWWSMDKLADSLPESSPYSYCLNGPLDMIDDDGNLPYPEKIFTKTYYFRGKSVFATRHGKDEFLISSNAIFLEVQTQLMQQRLTEWVEKSPRYKSDKGEETKEKRIEEINNSTFISSYHIIGRAHV